MEPTFVTAPPTTIQQDVSSGRAVKYGLLKRTNPNYDGLYWAELRALYEGGKRLLRDPELFERLFPKHEGERSDNYTERKKRAFYVNHLATAVDYLVAGLASDRLEMKPPESDLERARGPIRPVTPAALGDKKPAIIEISEVDPFYESFMKDCSHPAVRSRQRLNDLVLELAREGLLMGQFWTLVDMPRSSGRAMNLADQVASGELSPYAIKVPVECVLDWEETADGALSWANVFSSRLDRPSIFVDRDTVVEEFMYYTAEGWTKYVVEYSVKQDRPGPAKVKPKDDDLIQPVDGGLYTHGHVPLIRGKVPSGLWAGNKIFSLSLIHI